MIRAHLARTNAIREGIALAVRAPSIHNTQPWLWRPGYSTIDLHADTSYALTSADLDGRELLLSCGAALHHFCLALAARGWQSEVQRIPKVFDPFYIARIDLKERRTPSSADAEMSEVIRRRRTDRRRYDSRPIPPELLSELTSHCAPYGVTAHLADNDDRAVIASSFNDAAIRHSQNIDYQFELASWSGLHAMDDGVPASNVLDASSKTQQVHARVFAKGDLLDSDTAAHGADGSTWLVLSTSADDVLSRVRAGEAMSEVLLSATRMGLATCPMSEALEFPDLRKCLGEIASNDGFPQMIIRLGWPVPGAAELPPAPRRPIEDVLLPRREFNGSPVRWS